VIPLRRFAAAGDKSLLLVVLLAALAQPAAAQSRFEIGAGATWTGGFDAGGLDALETRNPSTGTSPLTLFATSSEVEPAAGVTARAAIFLTRRLAVEGFAEYGRPTLRTTILNDFEGATGSEATHTIASYLFGGTALFHFGGGRLMPFVSGGAGYLRQLDDEGTSVVSGTELHGGGGIKYRLSRHVLLRADAGVSSRDKSVAFEEKRRTVPQIAAAIAYRF
jgi:outer membrane protein with beta-barrel domain